MGSSEQAAGQRSPVSEMDATVQALNRIADAIVLLARATAGEFDEQPEGVEHVATDMAGRSIR